MKKKIREQILLLSLAQLIIAGDILLHKYAKSSLKQKIKTIQNLEKLKKVLVKV